MNISEANMDLFKVDKRYTIAHCISSDFALGAGIAKIFDTKFNSRRYLQDNYETCNVGVALSQFDHDRNIFHLATKSKYWQKPTYNNLQLALNSLLEQLLMYDIKYLAIPKLGCGLDKLDWNKVKEIIINTFSKQNVEILVCIQ